MRIETPRPSHALAHTIHKNQNQSQCCGVSRQCSWPSATEPTVCAPRSRSQYHCAQPAPLPNSDSAVGSPTTWVHSVLAGTAPTLAPLLTIRPFLSPEPIAAAASPYLATVAVQCASSVDGRPRGAPCPLGSTARPGLHAPPRPGQPSFRAAASARPRRSRPV